jgi:tRNA A-37 threonylcarbamoyl transferase component Bud32/tetratricopeptide (TPR) repeat protein
MGAVWSVRDLRTGRIGALKAIRSALLTDNLILARFRKELTTIASLEHPYIVRMLDFGHLLNGAPYMLMEQIDGSPLIDLPLYGRTFGELIRLFDRILAALAYAHSHRIIHRDLKPDNVLVFEDDIGELIPKLMDFGLAMAAVQDQASRLTADGMVVGTPAYMAPEQACDEQYKICPATDLYSFGCMLYEMLCGNPPHVAASPMALLLAHATKPPRPFNPLPSIPEAGKLESIVMRLLEKDPSDRFELAADLRKELRASGMLSSDVDVDLEPLGRYGDTVIGMSIPETPQVAQDGPRQPRPALRAASTQRVGEEQMLLSVLSQREPPMVDRDEARNQLLHYLEDVRQAGQTAVCMVHGPSGIGKTRLLRWFMHDGEARGALRYLYVEVGSTPSPSLSVLQAIIKHLRLRQLSNSHQQHALSRFFRTSDPEDWRVVEYLSLVRERSNDADPAISSALGRIDLLVYAGLEELSRSRPLVLALDDTHSANPRLVQRLVAGICSRQKTAPTPILLVLSDRCELDVPSDLELAIGKLDMAWLRSGIHLNLLSEYDLQAIACDGLRLAPRLAVELVKVASGLPLLAVALTQQWHTQGLLQITPDGFDCAAEPAELTSSRAVPKAVHRVILNRLESALASYEVDAWRPVAELAAVLGSVFSLHQLELGLEIVPKRVSTLEPALFIERALTENIIRASASGDYLFEYSNTLLRESLLSSTPSDRLTDLHRAAARAKLSTQQQSLAAYIEIGEHLLAGRSFREAFEVFFDAAQRHVNRGRYAEASSLLESAHRALAAQEGVSGPWDPRVAAVWECEAEIAICEGRLTDARERAAWIQHSGRRLDDPVWTARSQLLLGRVLRAEGDEATAHRLFGQTIELLLQLDEDVSRNASLARLYLLSGRERSEHIEKAEHYARHAQTPALLAEALLQSARHALRCGARPKAEKLLEEALGLALQEGAVRVEGPIQFELALLAEQAKPLLAEKRWLEASRAAEAVGDIRLVIRAHRYLARLMRETERIEDAVTHERWLSLIATQEEDLNPTPAEELASADVPLAHTEAIELPSQSAGTQSKVSDGHVSSRQSAGFAAVERSVPESERMHGETQSVDPHRSTEALSPIGAPPPAPDADAPLPSEAPTTSDPRARALDEQWWSGQHEATAAEQSAQDSVGLDLEAETLQPEASAAPRSKPEAMARNKPEPTATSAPQDEHEDNAELDEEDVEEAVPIDVCADDAEMT